MHGVSLKQFVFYGDDPGGAPLVHDEARWAAYVSDGLFETSISKEVLLMAPEQKPALLRRVFDLACVYSGQILRCQKCWGKRAGIMRTAGQPTGQPHAVAPFRLNASE